MIIRRINAKFTISMYCKRGQLGSKTHYSKECSPTSHANKQVFKKAYLGSTWLPSVIEILMYIKLTCGGICNDDPQKIRLIFDWFFFQFSKWAIKSDKNTDSWLNMLIDFFLCVVFFLLQKIEFEFVFLEKNECFTSIVLSIQFT